MEANRYSDFKIGKWFDFLLKFVTPTLLGITVVSNFVKGIKEVNFSGLIYGWGTVAAMLICATIFYKKNWKMDRNN